MKSTSGKRVGSSHFASLAAAASLLGLLVLAFLAGAAVIHFRLPSSQYLRGAFSGVKEVFASEPVDPQEPPYQAKVVTHSARACDGYTLVTTAESARATLLDMEGKVIHEWKMPENYSWPTAPGVAEPNPDEVGWQRCHV